MSATVGRRAFSGAASAIGGVTEASGPRVPIYNPSIDLARNLRLEALASGPFARRRDTLFVGAGLCPEGDTVRHMVNKSLPDAGELC